MSLGLVVHSVLSKPYVQVVEESVDRHLYLRTLQHCFCMQMSRAPEDYIPSVIKMFSFYKFNGVSEKIQTFKTFAALSVNRELGAEVDVPPFSYEVRRNDLP